MDRVRGSFLRSCGLLHLAQGRHHGTAAGVAKDHNESRTVLFGSELRAPDLGGGDDIARNPDNEQVTGPLVEDDLDRHA